MVRIPAQLEERELRDHLVDVEDVSGSGKRLGPWVATCACGWRGRVVRLVAVAADEAGMHRLAIEHARSQADAASARGRADGRSAERIDACERTSSPNGSAHRRPARIAGLAVNGSRGLGRLPASW